MSDRRFNEEEVAAIFKQATEAQQTPQGRLPSGDGLTLAELQDIGRQIGIAPELVVRAAASFGQVGNSTSRRWLGLPNGNLPVTAIAGLVGGPGHHYLTWAPYIAVLAAGQFAIGAIRVPGWARLRRKQMEEISGRLPLGLPSLPSRSLRDAEVGSR